MSVALQCQLKINRMSKEWRMEESLRIQWMRINRGESVVRGD